MGFSYNRNEALIEIIVRDSSGRKMWEAKCNGQDSNSFGKMIKFIRFKFGYFPDLYSNKPEEKKDEFFDF